MLKEAEAGRRIEEICRAQGVTATTFYAWRKKFSGMTVSDAKRLKALEEENRKLKRIVADQALEIVAIKDVLSKNW
jgi:putative transposase